MNVSDVLAPDKIDRFLAGARDLDEEAGPADCPPVAELARSWRSWGLSPGDLVILALPSGSDLLRQFFGVAAAGGVPALVAPGTPSARLRELVAGMHARAIGAPHMHRDLPAFARHGRLGRIQAGLFAAAPEPAAAPGEVVLLTSGTSGAPSGCVFGLDALLRNAARHADAIGQRPDDVVLVTLPLHFSFALVAQALATLLRGGRLVIAGPPFHPPSFARTIDEAGVTVSSLTPAGVRALFRSPGRATPRLRVLTVGGDALPPVHAARLLADGCAQELYLTYGLTQAGPRVSTLAAHREPSARHASVGLPLPGTSARLAPVGDGSGRTELLVTSDTLMRRRIGRVEGRPGADWRAPNVLATGDVFDQDGDGYLYFRGRLCDFIVRQGEKICLASVRREAAALPRVVRVRTEPVTREDGDADFDLVLVTDGAAPADPRDFRGALRRVLCRGEMPRHIRLEPEGGDHDGYK